ncbi:MAG: hypothetical protein RLZZ272_1126 [Actinomycetota bacterium]
MSADAPPPERGHDRVPPHSLEAEVSVLGACLLSTTAVVTAVQLLKPADFYRNAHRVAFEAIVALNQAQEPIDTVTVTEWLHRRGRLDEVGGAAALHDLTEVVPTAANAGFYSRIVRDKAMLRRLIDAGGEVTRLGFEATDDAPSVIDRAEAMIYELARTGEINEFRPLNDLLSESVEQIERLSEQRSEVTGLATGFDDLDRLTAGLQKQNLVIIAARPAMGKSALSLGIAHYVTTRLKRPVMLFSLEMSSIEIVNRLLSAEARIPSDKLRTGRLDDADWLRLSDALATLSEAPLFIDDSASTSMMEIRAKARRLKQRQGDLALVVVDYMQLMQSHRRVESRQQEVSEISRSLKMLAKELDTPVIALSQLSRNPEARTDKRPMLADLRESGSIEQDADIVGFIYNESKYDADTPDKGIVELIIAKHRNGATGVIKLAFLEHLAKFANLQRQARPAAPRPSGGGGAPATAGAPPAAADSDAVAGAASRVGSGAGGDRGGGSPV